MDITPLEIPTELLKAAKITPEEAKTELAIRLYQLHKLNEEQARELAGDSKSIETLAWNHQETGQVNMNEFLSWASHDLKSPLNTIIGFTRVVIKGIDGPINETQNADLKTAFNSSQRMLFLMNNLVEMARLNIGHVTLQFAECDMVELLQESADRWRTANPTKALISEIKVSQPSFHADKLHIRQMLSTLLTYAALRITEGSIKFTANDDANNLYVSIQSIGQKSVDKFELDSAMLNFVSSALVKLHGGAVEEPQETVGGLLVKFSLPRNQK